MQVVRCRRERVCERGLTWIIKPRSQTPSVTYHRAGERYGYPCELVRLSTEGT